MGDRIHVRDRRTLPFFQVNLKPLQEARNHTTGPARARTLGMYALLCEIANEQRDEGGHETLVASYDELAGRGRVSRSTVKATLDRLGEAGAVSVERRFDRLGGQMPNRLRLTARDGGWVAISVAASACLRDSDGGWLPDLGVLALLLEFCDEQRGEHGGARAEITRSDLARRSGYSLDGLDDRIRRLEAARVLVVTRQRRERGGNLPSLYDVVEPGQEHPVGREQPETDRAATGYRGGGERELGYGPASTRVAASGDSATGESGFGHPPQETRLPARRESQPGDPATPRTVAPPLRAPERPVSEQDTTENSPSKNPGGEQRGGEGELTEKGLCEALLAAWEPVLGEKPRRDYDTRREAWLKAAGRALGDHEPSRIRQALAYMTTDRILGSEAMDMPGFAKVLDKLIVRAHAAAHEQARTRPAATTQGGIGWGDAKTMLLRAISRHGRDGKTAATTELTAESHVFGAFIERVGWGALCTEAIDRRERDWRAAWESETARNALGEAA